MEGRSPGPTRTRLLFLLPSLLLFALTLVLATRPAPAGALQEGERQRRVVRAYFDDRQMVTAAAAWVAPWDVNVEAGYLVAEVGDVEAAALEAIGFRLEVDAERTRRLSRPNVRLPGQTSGIPGHPCYRTVEETYATGAQLAQDYPGLVTWTDVGNSWEKANVPGAGYDLFVLRLTNHAVAGPKPKLFVMSSVHAREYTPAEMNTRFAEYLAENYGVHPDVTWLLDHHEVHLLLQANPDGRKQAEAGAYWRKNTNQAYCGTDSPFRGADLNRNYPFQWGCCGGSSSYQCNELYRGEAAASEPETQAVRDYVRAEFADRRQEPLTAAAPVTTTGIFLDLHSYGGDVLWPWGFTDAVAPNGTALQTLGRKLAYFNDYTPRQAIEFYPTDGTTDGFAYGELGLAAFAFEMGTRFFESCGTFEGIVYPDNLSALLYAAKAARTPYQIPAGPDALEATVSPAQVTAGEPATLTVRLDDGRFSDRNGTEPAQAVAAAAYHVGAHPWVTETAILAGSMLPADGAFDQPAEWATATVDTSSLLPGRHLIYVRGRDTIGNWGAVSAAFLEVAPAPGTWRDAFFPVLQREGGIGRHTQ